MAVTITRNLKEINKEVAELDKNLKKVSNENYSLDRSLRLDPSSTILIGQKTENLSKQVSWATEKVNKLKDAQIKLKQQVQQGTATEDEYKEITLDIAKAEAQAKSFNAQLVKMNNQKLDKLQGSLKTVGRVATATVAAVTALGVAYAATGDKIADASEMYNISAEQFQRGTFIFDRATDNSEAYSAALQNMQKQLSAVERGSSRAILAFQTLGISVSEISGKSVSEVLDLVMSKLAKIEDVDRRITLANTLLSTAGSEVAAVAGLTAAEINELNAQLEKNGILTQEEVDNAAALQDRFEDLKGSIKKVGAELGLALIPLIQTLIYISSTLAPVLSMVAKVFEAMPRPLQAIIAALLIFLIILPKIISLFKITNQVLNILKLSSLSNPFMIIATAIALVIILVVTLIGYFKQLDGYLGKSYDLDINTGNLGGELTGLTANVATSGGGNIKNTNTTNYYDYSTTNVEAHTDADINEIASQLSTKIKVGGGR